MAHPVTPQPFQAPAPIAPGAPVREIRGERIMDLSVNPVRNLSGAFHAEAARVNAAALRVVR